MKEFHIRLQQKRAFGTMNYDVVIPSEAEYSEVVDAINAIVVRFEVKTPEQPETSKEVICDREENP